MRACLRCLLGLACLVVAILGLPTLAVRAAEGKVAVRAESGPVAGRLMFIWPTSVKATLSVADGRAGLQFSRALDGDTAPAVRRLAGWLSGVDAGPAAHGLTLHLRAGVGARLAAFHPRLTVVEFFHEQPPATTPTDAAMAAPPPPHRFIPLPVSRPTMLPATLPSSDGAVASAGPAPGTGAGPGGPPASVTPDGMPPASVKIAGTTRARGVELRFHWNAEVPAAVFQHRDNLWLVFGAAGADVAGWRSLQRPELAAWLEPETTRDVGGARLFRLRLNRQVDVSVRRESSSWIVQLAEADGRSPPVRAADILRRDEREGELVATVDGQLVQLQEPRSGERMGALLTTAADVRHPGSVRLVDLELLDSAQGLAWLPLADGVRGVVEDDRFVLTRQGGLRLSGAVAAAPVERATPAVPTPVAETVGGRTGEPAERTAAEAGVPAVPLGLSALAPATSVSRQRQRHDLLARLAGLRGTPQALARLELARLFLADALGAEAGAALELVPADNVADPFPDRVRQSRAALSGAAAALSGRADTALAILLDRMLDQDPEVALWRAYAAARAMRSDLAAQELERSNGVLDRYPTPLRRALGLELASALIDRGDTGPALALLEGLRPLDLPTGLAGRLHVLAGLAMADGGRPADAEREFQAAAATGDLDTRTRAAFLRLSLPAAHGTMSAAAAAQAMTARRAGWHGHPWESRMLRRLAELQTSAGQDDDALATLEAAAATSPNPDAAAEITRDLARKVRGILQADDAIEAAPVTALARYRLYGRYLDGGHDDAALRARLAKGAAASGLLTTAAALGGAADGSADPPGGAAADLADAPADTAVPWRRQALFQTGDWASLADSAAADLPADHGATPLGPTSAEAAVWLGLAQAQLGHPDAAAAVADRYGPKVDRETAALLRLAATVPQKPASLQGLPAAVGAFAGELRAALDALPAGPGT